MKILMICEFFDPALEFQENQLVKYYRKHGHEVRVLTSTYTDVFDYYACRHDNKAPESSLSVHGAEIVRLPYRYNLLHKIRAYRGVKRHLEEFEPDLIYIHDIMPNILEIVPYLKKHPQCRAIMDIHMDYSNSGKSFVALRILHGTVRRWFLSRIRPHLDRIYPVAPSSFPFMRDIYGVPESAMTLLPLGADIDLIEAIQASTDREALRRSYGFGPDQLVIVTGGKVTPRKRFETLLEAVDCDALAHAVILVIGKIPEEEAAYRAALQPLIDRLGDRVRFAGWQLPEGTYSHMSAADVAVFPASQSVMWQQAISVGLPLIVGDNGGQDASYLGPHGNVQVLPADQITAEGVRAALVALDRDPERMRAMAEGSRRTAREMLDWNALIEVTLKPHPR